MTDRLKKRADFLRAAQGNRAALRSFVLQARRRPAGDSAPPRFGFTVTKKTAPLAVERNRIKRRLRELIRQTRPEKARPGYDYVLIGRRLVLERAWDDLIGDLSYALRKVHKPAGGAKPRSGRKSEPKIDTSQKE